MWPSASTACAMPTEFSAGPKAASGKKAIVFPGMVLRSPYSNSIHENARIGRRPADLDGVARRHLAAVGVLRRQSHEKGFLGKARQHAELQVEPMIDDRLDPAG